MFLKVVVFLTTLLASFDAISITALIIRGFCFVLVCLCFLCSWFKDAFWCLGL